jgi:hypothetical protein
VSWIDWDAEKDQMYFLYDPGRLTPGQVLEAVGKQGFQGTIVPGAAPPDGWPEAEGN